MRRPFVDRRIPIGKSEHGRTEQFRSYASELKSAGGTNWLDGSGPDRKLFVQVDGDRSEFAFAEASTREQREAFLWASDWLSSRRMTKERQRTPLKAVEDALEAYYMSLGLEVDDQPEDRVRRFVIGLTEYAGEHGIDLAAVVDDPGADRIP